MGNATVSLLFKQIVSFLVFVLFVNNGTLFSQTIRYVDASKPDNSGAGTSWASAERDLQIAINTATAGDQVWVKSGTYLPTHDPFGSTSPANNRDKSFTLKEGVKVYGGFAGTETQLSQRNWKLNITTLSGDLGIVNTLTDNSYHVVLSVNLTNASVLDGFTITKGYATAPWQSNVTIVGRVIDRYKGAGIYNAYSSTQFTNLKITQNSADCTDQNDDAWGAGIVNDNSSSALTDCLIEANSFLVGGNSFGVFGAGMIIAGGNCTLTRCVFSNNTSGSGFLDGSRGGALNLLNGPHTLVNCIFYNNSAMNGAAIAFGGGEYNNSLFVNCTFANNTSSFAGTAFSGFADATFRNCIFWNNNPTSSSVAGRNEIFSQETRSQFWPTFNNCIIRDATGSPLSVTNTVTSNILNGNPLFINYSDGDGADNIWGTADDGLRLQCSSPAIGYGAGTTPETDYLLLTRTSPLDLGAYEGQHTNAAVNPLPTAATTVQISLNASGTNHFSTCTNLIAAVQSGTPYTIAGTVTAKVWIQGTQPVQFVRRHYEIYPQQNASTATGRVTLYFTQADFDAYNNQIPAPVNRLPTNAGDALGIQNIYVEKRDGVSTNGTGLPSSYTGSISTINPADADIVWNSTASRWEVTFNVTGFSGFFIKTISSTLPLTLIDFTALRDQACDRLEWKTRDESGTDYFEIEASKDAFAFSPIGKVVAVGFGSNSYMFNECLSLNGFGFYRLKIIDKDGKWQYSKTISLLKTQNNKDVAIYPTFTNNSINIKLNNSSLLNTWFKIVDINGRVLIVDKLNGFQKNVTIDHLKPGTYQIIFNNNLIERFIKL